MTSLKESWLQEIMDSLRLAPLSPAMCKILLPFIEMHIKRISQQAHKFQRRAKSARLSVDDLNLALAMNKVEAVYGLSKTDSTITGPSSRQANAVVLGFADMAKNCTLPPCPLKPDISLHWLAVNGSQPLIAENPSIVSAEAEEQPFALPKEMQRLYARVTGIILTASSQEGDASSASTLQTVFSIFETDAGIQDLLPYLSRFFYQQIKTNTKRLPLLYAVIRAIRALLRNSSLNMEAHLQQLLPVIFTCIVSPKLSTSAFEDHWSLRNTAAEIISFICSRFSDSFLDLQARVLKTYVSALGEDKSLVTLYGGVVGLTAMGPSVIRSILVAEHLHVIHNRLLVFSNKTMQSQSVVIKTEIKSEPGSSSGASSNGSKRARLAEGGSSASLSAEEMLSVEMCKGAVLRALGCYMVSSMRLPTSASVLAVSRRGGQGSGAAAGRAKLPLCDLEEALIPYYVTASVRDYYCRLMI